MLANHVSLKSYFMPSVVVRKYTHTELQQVLHALGGFRNGERCGELIYLLSILMTTLESLSYETESTATDSFVIALRVGFQTHSKGKVVSVLLFLTEHHAIKA
jgi:hypothetical protein